MDVYLHSSASPDAPLCDECFGRVVGPKRRYSNREDEGIDSRERKYEIAPKSNTIRELERLHAMLFIASTVLPGVCLSQSNGKGIMVLRIRRHVERRKVIRGHRDGEGGRSDMTGRGHSYGSLRATSSLIVSALVHVSS